MSEPMLVTADWVLPVSRPPIRNGGVLVEHGIVTEVGVADELTGLMRDSARRDLPGCVLLPGLVNAHTHLSLTAMGGLLEPAPLDEWLPRLVAMTRAWGPGDHAASASLGARHCLESGVTVVGDITPGPEAPSAAADEGVGGLFYWEVLGLKEGALEAELERIEFPLEDFASCGARIRCGLSPHSPYTAGPALLRAVHQLSAQRRIPVAIHLAESAAEVRLLRDGTGPLADVASRTAIGFAAPGTTPVRYLDELGVLDGATAIHLGHAAPTDIVRLAATARGAVACPRSNAFLQNPVAPVSRLLRGSVPMGLGTDSAVSNSDLDILEEVRALRTAFPDISAHRLIEMVTAMGAIALGVDDRFGMIERGMQGDLAAFRLGPTDDPEGALVERGGRATLAAVLTGGVWRVLDGRVTSAEDVETPAAISRERAARALAEGGFAT